MALILFRARALGARVYLHHPYGAGHLWGLEAWGWGNIASLSLTTRPWKLRVGPESREN